MATVRDIAGHNLFTVDQHLGVKSGVNDSYTVTPSDTVDLPNGACNRIICAVGGNVKVTYANGVTDTVFLNAGTWHIMNIKRVWNTGTAATGISVSG